MWRESIIIERGETKECKNKHEAEKVWCCICMYVFSLLNTYAAEVQLSKAFNPKMHQVVPSSSVCCVWQPLLWMLRDVYVKGGKCFLTLNILQFSPVLLNLESSSQLTYVLFCDTECITSVWRQSVVD